MATSLLVSVCVYVHFAQAAQRTNGQQQEREKNTESESLLVYFIAKTAAIVISCLINAVWKVERESLESSFLRVTALYYDDSISVKSAEAYSPAHLKVFQIYHSCKRSTECKQTAHISIQRRIFR